MHTCHHPTCIHNAMHMAEQICTRNHTRLTPSRRAVLGIIWQNHKALTPAEIMRAMGEDKPPITYRALGFLEEQGLIHKVAALNAYVGCPCPADGPHTSQLFICRHCRMVEEIPMPGWGRTVRAHAQQRGFTPEKTHLEIVGLCAACAAMQKEP